MPFEVGATTHPEGQGTVEAAFQRGVCTIVQSLIPQDLQGNE